MVKRKRHVLISAGPTQEPLDPVRYISNRSSGKMGYALAKTARNMGFRVTLVSGPVALKPPPGCKMVSVRTAREMETAMVKNFRQADITICVAAVADYRPESYAARKIKKTRDKLTIHLVRNPDILARLGRLKRANQVLVGFAAETHHALHFGREKLVRKNLDWIAINNVAQKGTGFESDENQIALLHQNGECIAIPRALKSVLAKKILEMILK